MAQGGNDPIVDINKVLLESINNLRVVEDRLKLPSLSKELQDLSHPRKLLWIERANKEVRWHIKNKQHNKVLDLPYKNQIFLNETEKQLWDYNIKQHALDLPQVQNITYLSVPEKDKDYYYPDGSDKSLQVFITDTDSKYISTPTYVGAGTQYRSTHTFTQITIRATSPPLSAQAVSTPKPGGNPPPLSQSTLGASYTEYRTPQANSSDASKSSSSDSETEVDNISKMDEAMARVAALEKDKADLADNLRKMQLQPRAVKTERQEIGDLKTAMNEVMTMIKVMQAGQQLNATNETERLVVNKFSQPNLDMAPPLSTHDLERPTNIIPAEEARAEATLHILKPQVITSTIGTYDPDTQPEADFRGIWDRILDHTRNHRLYEHEYITCLRMVMKGSAASALDKMNKEYKGDINLVLEAIQDLFIPQHTIYDDFDELNSFKRKPNEHMRTMVRRASLLIYKLKDTVAPAAWPDRRHTLLSQIIKQVIDKKTFKHLRSEELKCAQLGTSLTIEAMTNIIEFYETSHELIPTTEIKLTYNVNTMRLTDQPNVHQTEMDEIKQNLLELQTSIKSLAPKRMKTSLGPSPAVQRQMVRGRRRLDKMDTLPPGGPKGIKRTAEDMPATQSQPLTQSQTQPLSRTQSYPQGLQQSQGRTQYPTQQRQTYSQSRNPNVSYHPSQTQVSRYGTQNTSQTRYTPNNDWLRNPYQKGRSKSPGYPRRGYNQRGRGYQGYQNNQGYRNYQGNRGQYEGKPRTYRFKDKKHDVTLHFYKCSICAEPHQEGTSCDAVKAISFSPNA